MSFHHPETDFPGGLERYRAGSAGRLARIALDILRIRPPIYDEIGNFYPIEEELGPDERAILSIYPVEPGVKPPVWFIPGHMGRRQPFTRLRFEHEVDGIGYAATVGPKPIHKRSQEQWLYMLELPFRYMHQITFKEFVLNQPVDRVGTHIDIPTEAMVMGRDLGPQALAAKNLLDG